MNQRNEKENREGYWEEYYNNGQLDYKGHYKDGVLDGYWERYYYNGQLWRKGHYKDGKREGYWEFFYDNGQLYYKEFLARM